MKKRIYLAGPLFSEAEKSFNRRLRDILAHRYSVYLPQEDGKLLVEMTKKGMDAKKAGRWIFKKDVEEIKKADFLFIILDGRAIDEGSVFELGVSYSLRKKCYGLQTDPRRLLPEGNNPMIQNALTRVFFSIEEVEKWVGKPTRAKP